MTEINSYVDLKWLPVVEKFRHEAKIITTRVMPG